MSRSFTLIELLIVVAVVAILSVVVILALNPAELLKQARDSARLADLNTLHKALGIFQAGQPSGGLGNTSTTYLSLVDPAATSTSGTNCASLGLPGLPAGYFYHCAASSTLRNIDGTGWVPVNLLLASGGAPISQLPVDPVNASSSGFYYTYTPGSDSWELTALVQSLKYRTRYFSRHLSGLIAAGRSSALSPIYGDSGLSGWWKFDEGSGTNAADSSGNGNTGTLTNGPTWTNGVVGGALNFDGVDDYVSANGIAAGGSFGNAHTITAWARVIDWTNSRTIAGAGNTSNEYSEMNSEGNNKTFSGQTKRLSWNVITSLNTYSNDNGWHYFALAVNDAGQVVGFYVDGVSQGSGGLDNDLSTLDRFYVGQLPYGSANALPWSGAIDEVRVYNRVLTSAEIAAIYNATK